MYLCIPYIDRIGIVYDITVILTRREINIISMEVEVKCPLSSRQSKKQKFYDANFAQKLASFFYAAVWLRYSLYSMGVIQLRRF